jgi:phospholipase C
MGDYPAEVSQIDNDVVIPYYSWLAKQFTFCDRHFGVGSNSTPGHMMLVCGQTPTLRNYFTTPRDWDLPTIFKHAEKSGLTWGAFPDGNKYPTSSFTELKQDKGF